MLDGNKFFPETGTPILNSARRMVKFEVWLPGANWNGKFHGIGNGGFAGSISYGGLAGALARGYATASTDTGHSGGDASWALGHPEKIVDYGHRAIHEMTVAAKRIVDRLSERAFVLVIEVTLLIAGLSFILRG